MTGILMYPEVKETSRILKFEEGENPETDEPYEVVEQTRILSNEEVQSLVDQGLLVITPQGKAEWVPAEKKTE